MFLPLKFTLTRTSTSDWDGVTKTRFTHSPETIKSPDKIWTLFSIIHCVPKFWKPKKQACNFPYYWLALLDSEKALATHSSTLAWRTPRTEEPGRLESMRLLRVGDDWASLLSLFTFMHWRKMETHSSVLAWRIPGTGEPGGLPSMGSHRVGHDWRDLAAAAAAAFRLQHRKG